jgi:hypothetical protein
MAASLLFDPSKAIKGFQQTSQAVSDVGKAVRSSSGQTSQLTQGVYLLSGAMIGLGGTAITMGSVAERALLDVNLALEMTSASVSELQAEFVKAEGSALALLRAAGKLAAAGMAGEELKIAAKNSILVGEAMGTSTKDAVKFQSDLHRALNQTADEMLETVMVGRLLTQQARIDNETWKQYVLTQKLAANAVKLNDEASYAFLGTLNATGIRGAAANGMLDNLITRFERTNGSGAELAAVLDYAGLSMDDFNKATGTGKLDMFLKSVKALGGPGGDMLRATRITMEMTGATETQARTIVTATAQHDKFGKVLKGVQNAMNNQVARQKEMVNLQKTLSYQTKRLWSDFEDIGLVIGEFLVPIAKVLVASLRSILGVFKNLSPVTQQLIIGITTVAAVWLTLQKIMSTKVLTTIIQTIAYMGNLILAKMGDATATAAVAKANAAATVSQWSLNKAMLKNIAASGWLMIKRTALLLVTGHWLTATELAAAATAKNTAMQYGAASAVTANTVATVANTSAAQMGFLWNVRNLIVRGALNIATWTGVAALFGWTGASTAATAATAAGTAVNIGFAASLWAIVVPLAIIALKVLLLIAVFWAVYEVTGVLLKALGLPFIHLHEVVGGATDSVGGFGGMFTGVFDAIGGVVGGFTGLIGSAFTAVIDFFTWINGGIASGFIATVGLISDLASGLADILVSPFVFMMAAIDSTVEMFEGMMAVITALAAPFKPFLELIKSAIGLAWKVKDAIFGSSMFHIKEGAAEIMPHMKKVEGAFTGIQRAAATVADGTQLPEEIRVKIQDPITSAASGQAPAPPTSAPTGGGQSAMPRGPMAPAASGPAGPIRVSIPVRVELDGMVLARAMTEHTIEIANERHFNEPTHPLRGIEK